MSQTTEEVIRVLTAATDLMTASEISAAGNFDSPHLVAVALHDMCLVVKNPPIVRVKPQDTGKFKYRLATPNDVGAPVPPARDPSLGPSRTLKRDMPETRSVALLDRVPSFVAPVLDVKKFQALYPNPPTAIPAMSPKPAAVAAPANDGAYAAVLFDLRKKRGQVADEALALAQELHKIDAAILAVEALA